MSYNAQKLYELLPAIYRLRDTEQDESLKTLLSIIAEQVAVLEENLEQLYDDQFIETCAEWVIPYIGDLIGYRSLHGVTSKVSNPRAEVANTIGYRRRKGTAAMLEQLARDVTGWNARVVEFFQLLATTQYMNHIRPQNWYAPDLRLWEPLERLNTPFDTIVHTVDVRRIVSRRGKHNIPNIGIYVWRLNSYSLTESPAFKVDDRRYLFNPLGNDTQLFTRPETEDEITHLAKPINVPQTISRRVLYEYLDRYYGKEKSLFLVVDGIEIETNDIQVGNLSDTGSGDWAHMPQENITIDPVLGRIAFPEDQSPTDYVKVTFHYGFSADMGGGEYERRSSFDIAGVDQTLIRAPDDDYPTIQDALDGLPDAGGIVEITDSGRYEENIVINVKTGASIELRAANEHRPSVVLNGDLIISGETDSEVTLNGLLITGGTMCVSSDSDNKLRRLCLRHCTLVPGLSLTTDGDPEYDDEPSIIVELTDVSVEIDHCILGGLRIAGGSNTLITNSIIDATDETKIAYSDIDGDGAGGTLQIENSTVLGKVHTRLLELASNTIIMAGLAQDDTWATPIQSVQKQTGCVRFSYLPEESSVPKRYHCQPSLAIQKAIESALKKEPELTNAQEELIATDVRVRLKPMFTAQRYGQPAYMQLSLLCPEEIRTGADDESEMGAFHELYQPQRETNLNVRLDEYLRFGLEAGIIYVT